MDDDKRGPLRTEKLGHVLYVGKDCVLQPVAGVRPTTTFSCAQVLGEPGREIHYVLVFDTQANYSLLSCRSKVAVLYLIATANQKQRKPLRDNRSTKIVSVNPTYALSQFVFQQSLRK